MVLDTCPIINPKQCVMLPHGVRPIFGVRDLWTQFPSYYAKHLLNLNKWMRSKIEVPHNFNTSNRLRTKNRRQNHPKLSRETDNFRHNAESAAEKKWAGQITIKCQASGKTRHISNCSRQNRFQFSALICLKRCTWNSVSTKM